MLVAPYAPLCRVTMVTAGTARQQEAKRSDVVLVRTVSQPRPDGMRRKETSRHFRVPKSGVFAPRWKINQSITLLCKNIY